MIASIREQFIKELITRITAKIIVEVGVKNGDFSDILLSTFPTTLYLVDPWEHVEGYKDIANVSEEEHNIRFRAVSNKYKSYSNVIILRHKSIDAAKILKPVRPKIDLVYIDANHNYDNVRADLEAWYPLTKVIAGHDYVEDGMHEGSIFGVKKAVDEFAAEKKLKVIVSENEKWPSWYLEKLIIPMYTS